ncbi:MAG TPA: hybrid sensor histidine kinase/response regulator [Chloroflexota bacterium]|jgi:signal transduction histidine kinase
MSIRALLVEDNPGDARLIREMLGSDARAVELAHTDHLAAGLAMLESDRPDVMLLDLSLPDSQGIATFQTAHTAAPGVPIVVLSGLDDEELAMRAVHEGAQDYLVKGQVDGGAILRSLRYAIERQRLEAARHDLERQRDEFFSSVSHDLRTPVAAIKAAVGVVLANEPPGTSPALHRLLSNIDLASDELTRLIDDLLEMARLQAGRVELYVSEVDLRDVVTRAVQSLEPLIQARGQALELRLPSESVVAAIDVQRFGRAVRNLVGNAQKYGRHGGRITLVLERTPTEVMLVIADDGPGIPLPEQERIFDRFYRGSRSGGDGPIGSGLGLPIARGLVELHGGSLTLESELGQGSTFRVHLPV